MVFNLSTPRRTQPATTENHKLVHSAILVIYNNQYSRVIRLFALFTALFLADVNLSAQTQSYTISNTAFITYQLQDGQTRTSTTNTVELKVTQRTPSTLEFFQYAPAYPGALLLPIGASQYNPNNSGDFAPLDPPTFFGTPLDLSQPLPVVPVQQYHQGEPAFLRLTDYDQNTNPDEVEIVQVTISVGGNINDREIITLIETGPNTGVFTGYIPTGSPPPTQFDGELTVGTNIAINATYTDIYDQTDAAAASAIVDPYGVVFNSETGVGVNGVVVTMMDLNTGNPAQVFGDDGVSDYPETMTTGGTVIDQSGRVYNYPQGTFRFPFVYPGNYQFVIELPVNYRAPSVLGDAFLQTLPGAPFALEQGSRLDPFVVNPGPALHIDIPVDPLTIQTTLKVRKFAAANIIPRGDTLEYLIEIENPGIALPVEDVRITDILPVGFNYQTGKSTLDGVAIADPDIAGDGRTLIFPIGTVPQQTIRILRYQVVIDAGMIPGDATNQVSATGKDGTEVIVSNEATAMVMVVSRTNPQIEFFKYSAPNNPAANQFVVSTIPLYQDGNGNMHPMGLPGFGSFPGSIHFSEGQLQAGISTIPADSYSIGEPAFLRVIDGDQNRDPNSIDSILITISVNGDEEILRLYESGPNTGVFNGYIQTDTPPATFHDGELTVSENIKIVAVYIDPLDPEAVRKVEADILVDPFGLIFDSQTGQGIDGVTITLIDTRTGQPAEVFGDDGFSTYPSTIISGGTATDSSGRVYAFPTGMFRFPLVHPEVYYRYQISPPATHSLPSVVPDAVLQTLPGAPFVLDIGSRLESFFVPAGPPVRIDVPMDPVILATDLFARKSVDKSTAGIGEFLVYSVEIENPGSALPALDVVITDILPSGFRYTPRTAKVDGLPFADPVIAADGRTMTFAIGTIPTKTSVKLSYLVEVGAGAKLGRSTNVVSATGTDGQNILKSNAAGVEVQVQDDLMKNKTLIIGRVTAWLEVNGKSTGNGHPETNGKTGEYRPVYVEQTPGKDDKISETTNREIKGVPGIRIYLEDGTYVLTDERGMYHIEGVKPGTHIVQLDIDTIPEQYELMDGWNNRFAGRGYSQFVDVQGGTMWRADFKLKEKAPPMGYVGIQLTGKRDNQQAAVVVTLKSEVVKVSDMQVVIMMPPGTVVDQDSVMIPGSKAEMKVTDAFIQVKLPTETVNWEQKIEFACDLSKVDGEAVFQTMALFKDEDAKSIKTPKTEMILQQTGDSGMQTVEVIGKFKVKQDDVIDINDYPKPQVGFNHSWLDKTEPENAWAYPTADYLPPLPFVNVGIKHLPKHKVKLFLAGKEVNVLLFEEDIMNSDKTVGLSSWHAVSLKDGDNIFEAVFIGPEGNEVKRVQHKVHVSTSPVRAVFVPEKSFLVADGKTPPVIAVRLTDRDGFPVRFGGIGEFTVNSPYAGHEKKESFDRNLILGIDGSRSHYRVGYDGIALLKLEPTSASGEVTVKFNFGEDADDKDEEIMAWLSPGLRDWILVGLADGTVGYNTISKNMHALVPGDEQEDFYDENRIAFFAKGKILGKYLLTMSYDTDKVTNNDSQKQTIDPNTYYTLYGDATNQQYETASAEKLYVKIERGMFYALFGDFDTGLSVTELSRYSRSLTGVKTEYQSKNFEFNGFVSDTNLIYVRDEIRGDGTSGLYRLSRKSIVLNSEKITIETRDRFRSEIIRSSQTQARHVDYDIDYTDGTLYFKRPIFSRDHNLDPIFIIIEYESDSNQNTAYNYGGRGAVKFLDEKLEIGATHAHEEQDLKKADLYGADFSYEFMKDTEFKAEIARTDNENLGMKSDGSAYITEISHNSAKYQGKVYLREQNGAFGMGQQNGSENGTRKMGVEGGVKVTDHVKVSGLAYRENNLSTDAERDVMDGTVEYSKDRYAFRTGLVHAEDKQKGGTNSKSLQSKIGGDYRMLDNRLTFRVDHYQSLSNSNENSDFPTRTIYGADYNINPKVAVFGEHEITDGDSADTHNSRVGLKTKPWEGGNFDTAISRELSENSERMFAVMGLGQQWQVNERWSLSGGIDQSRTIMDAQAGGPFNVNTPSSSGGREDFTALSLGGTYNQTNYSWATRIEERMSDSEDKHSLQTGIIGQMKKGLTLSLRTQVYQTDAHGGDDTLGLDVSQGLAYRPWDEADWIVFNRLDYIYDEVQGSSTNTKNQRLVELMNANYQPIERWQNSFKLGLKYTFNTIDGEFYDGLTSLLGYETRYDITKRFDLGFRTLALHSWNLGTTEYSAGPSIGCKVIKNVWVSVGYNLVGFYDRDFSRGEYTSQGVYFRFRIKFDQDSMKEFKHFLGWRD